MAKAAQDINRFLNAGSGAQVQVPGEFIYCKFTESPIRVTIGNTQNSVVMEAGDKIRLEQPFSDFRIENVGDYPTSMVLVVGWGDYWRQIIQGEVSVLPGVRDESGRFKPDTRHDLVIYFEPVLREGFETQRGDTKLIAETGYSPRGMGWDRLRNQHMSGQSDHIFTWYDRAGQVVRTLTAPTFDGPDDPPETLQPNGMGAVDSQGTLYVPTADSDLQDPYGLRRGRLWRVHGALIDYPGQQKWQETDIIRPLNDTNPQSFAIAPDDTFWEQTSGTYGEQIIQYDTGGNLLRQWSPVDDQGNGVQFSDIEVTTDRVYGLWMGFPDRIYEYTLDGDYVGYFEIDKNIDTPAGLGRNNIGTLTLHAPPFGGTAGLYDLELADEYFSFFGAAVSGGCRSGLGLKQPDVQGVRTGADVSVVQQDGRALATGELVRALLEIYFGRYIRADYLDHVYRVDFQNGLGADTGARTFAAASQPDQFAAIFPQQVTITVDNGIYQSE